MALTSTSWAVAPFSSTKSLGQAQLCSPAQSRNAPRHACRAASSSSSSSKLTEIRLARDDLLGLIATEERGVKTQHDATKRAQILEAIETLGVLGREQTTTDADALSATWRMLWTTEKEQLFIIDKSPLFGTRAGEVLQVIDVQRGTLNNVITFPPSGLFVVDSTIEVVSKQRVNFRFALLDAAWDGCTVRIACEQSRSLRRVGVHYNGCKARNGQWWQVHWCSAVCEWTQDCIAALRQRLVRVCVSGRQHSRGQGHPRGLPCGGSSTV